MSRKTDSVGKKIAISVQFDVVLIEVIFGDEYAAQVLYDDLIDRLRSGDGICLSVKQSKEVAE